MANKNFSIPYRDKDYNRYRFYPSDLIRDAKGDWAYCSVDVEKNNKYSYSFNISFNFSKIVEKYTDLKTFNAKIWNEEKDSTFLRNIILDYIFDKDLDKIPHYHFSETEWNNVYEFSDGSQLNYRRNIEIQARENQFARTIILREMYLIQNARGPSGLEYINESCNYVYRALRNAKDGLINRGYIYEYKNVLKLSHEAQQFVENILLSSFSNQIFLIAACQPDIEKMIELVYKPAVNELGYTLFFQEASEPKDKIHDEMWESLERCKLVLCDFTHERPNCFIEYGFAYGKKKHILLTVSDVGWEDVNGRVKMPFDTLTQKFSIWQEEWLTNPEKFPTEIESFKNDLKGRISRKLQIIDSQSEI